MPEQACGQRIADLTARLDGLRAHRNELAGHQEHPPKPLSFDHRQGQSVVR
jgi:hypothetical protein